nr:hypothetical protein [Tanacetum cinerariifolium]
VEVYDLDCDDASTASAIFMAKLSPTGSISRDESGPSYDSDILSEYSLSYCTIVHYLRYWHSNWVSLNLRAHQLYVDLFEYHFQVLGMISEAELQVLADHKRIMYGSCLRDLVLSIYVELRDHYPIKFRNGKACRTRMQTLKDLTPEEMIRKKCDIRGANIILHGVPNDIYTLLNHKTKAYDIWYRVKKLIEGTKLTKQERESKLADEFDRFTSEKGETIQSYYMRFAILMNDINIIGLHMTRLQVNTKFVNHLQPEWSRFVTGVKQARNLHKVSFDKLYAYLKQNEQDANEYNPQMPVVAQQQPYIPQPTYEPPVVYQQPSTIYQQPPAIYQQPPTKPTSLDSGFIVPNFLPMDDPIASLNKAMMFLTTAISHQPTTKSEHRLIQELKPTFRMEE